MSRQACNFWAIDFGLPGVALAASAGAASLDAFLDLVPFGLTCTSGLSPTIGCFGGSLVCAMAAAEYSTAAITKIFFISLRFRPEPNGMEGNGANMRPNKAKWRNPQRIHGLSATPRSPSPETGGKHGAAVLSRCRLQPAPGLPDRPRPGRDNRQQRQRHKGRRHIARAMQEIPAIEDGADRRADRLADIEHGGVERDGSRGQRRGGRDQ